MSSVPATAARVLLTAALSATLVMVGAGCGEAERGNDATARPALATSSPTTSTSTTGSGRPKEENGMRVTITIGDQRFDATLGESPAARDLAAQLPVTIDMVDHGQVEKTGRLPSPLSVDGQAEGADPDVGDLGYYAPGNDLVLYYGDQSYFPGIVILGRLESDAAGRIAGLDGPVTATVEVHGG